jgi:indolepyruvate ferredoxin oxidoreductase
MNALPTSLEDKYTQETGSVYLNGLQALVRALLNQRARDRREGLNTAGFVSGYRGSPLGTFDKELWRAAAHLARAPITFVPGVNEELAANAVAGTQQVGLFPGPRYAGVYALWYGKGPGVDRCGDVFRHANLAGTASRGGVLLVCGDDHGGISTTTNHQSDLMLRALQIPMLLPATLQDVLDLTVHGWALSRYTGLFVGLKALADTIEVSTSVDCNAFRVSTRLPSDLSAIEGSLGIRWPDDRWSQERRLHERKLPALKAYVRTNELNPITFAHPHARFGIIASGKAYLDLMQALSDFRIGANELKQLGIRICKVALPWPLDPESILEFAANLEEIVVIEEKEPIVETQLRDLLYGLAERGRPRVLGKSVDNLAGAGVAELLPASGDFNVARVSRAIGSWLLRYADMPSVRERLAFLNTKGVLVRQAAASVSRSAYYCSGCPHSTSTKVPEGSFALAGVGCHYLSLFIHPQQTRTFSVMGVEGSNWIGIAPFSETAHTFVNLGEGSYFHSSILAIRAAVAARVNVTYRILYNDAVAMTGGQLPDGPLTVSMMVAQLKAERVAAVAVVADELEVTRKTLDIPTDMPLHRRAELRAVERMLRDMPGCTVLIYVQTCAAEKRRRRKRHDFPDPPQRVLINSEVCEGCGDCGQQSNCVSVVPLQTELGVKRAIDQSNCNKDFSCLDGFCPSFVTVHGGRLRSPRTAGPATNLVSPPEPVIPMLDELPYNVLVTGIGGTGVITIGALLGMAAHLEGRAVTVLDMTGMAQKNGGVQSHIRIARDRTALMSARIPTGSAHLALACDLLEAASPDALDKIAPAHTCVIANSDLTMPGGYAQHPEMEIRFEPLRDILMRHADASRSSFIAASALATRLTGNSIGANLLLLGFAYQAGCIPIGAAAIERAIELNGVAVEANKLAFRVGRQARVGLQAEAHGGEPAFKYAAVPSATVLTMVDLVRLIEDRRRRLVEYCSEQYAERYVELVARVRSAEAALAPDSLPLTEAVARYYYKLLAIKDEYEVARLFTVEAFRRQLEETFEGPYKVRFHLAPPLWAKVDRATGRPRKRAYGGWMMLVFRVLAAVRRVRGTLLDPFRFSAERRFDNQLASDYEALMGQLAQDLNRRTLPIAIQLARLPERIRGFGPVRQAGVAALKPTRERLMARLDEARTSANSVGAAPKLTAISGRGSRLRDS